MPQDLTNQKILDTYQQLLHLDGGATSTDKVVYDGDGTAVGLKVSTSGIDASALKIAGTAVTATAAELNFVDGVTSNIQTQLNAKAGSLGDLGITATATELNVLDGVTASTAELNYTDGVTSNIQTQLNAKIDGANIIEQSDIGTAPNEIPLNQYLGSMAYRIWKTSRLMAVLQHWVRQPSRLSRTTQTSARQSQR